MTLFNGYNPRPPGGCASTFCAHHPSHGMRAGLCVDPYDDRYKWSCDKRRMVPIARAPGEFPFPKTRCAEGVLCRDCQWCDPMHPDFSRERTTARASIAEDVFQEEFTP